MSKIKIAAVLDEFSYMCFKYECNMISLERDNWKETLKKEKPDLLLVESAWKRDYKKLIRSKPPKLPKTMVDWCKAKKIPTVFWNKEDPYYFDYFLKDAQKFDLIFTTDINCIQPYQKSFGHDRVFGLPFAAQPKLHNPIDKETEKLGNILFAGTWYSDLPEREADLILLLEPSLRYQLHIYDRNYQKSRQDVFPEAYQSFIKGKLPYAKMVSAYKKYDIILNVNTIKNSPTMFSRRVFEALACGVNVISNYALGVERTFPDIVKLSKSEAETKQHLIALMGNKMLRDRLSLLGQRAVFSQHTYAHRMDTILQEVGLDYNKVKTPGVSIIVRVERLEFRTEDLPGVLANFERQSYARKELILLLPYNHKLDRERWNKKVKIIEIGQERTRQEALKIGAEQAKYDYISWFDCDNYYATAFVSDLMNAFKYADADAVGKCSYYACSSEDDSLEIRLPDLEYRYTDFLISSAMIAKRASIDQIRFFNYPKPKEAEICISCGCNDRFYAADRFNFIYKISQSGMKKMEEACV